MQRSHRPGFLQHSSVVKRPPLTGCSVIAAYACADRRRMRVGCEPRWDGIRFPCSIMPGACLVAGLLLLAAQTIHRNILQPLSSFLAHSVPFTFYPSSHLQLPRIGMGVHRPRNLESFSPIQERPRLCRCGKRLDEDVLSPGSGRAACSCQLRCAHPPFPLKRNYWPGGDGVHLRRRPSHRAGFVLAPPCSTESPPS